MTSEDTGADAGSSLTNAAAMDSAAATVDEAGTVAMNSSAVHVLLCRFYPDFVQNLTKNYTDFLETHFSKCFFLQLYPNFIQIVSRFYRNSFYQNVIQILS